VTTVTSAATAPTTTTIVSPPTAPAPTTILGPPVLKPLEKPRRRGTR
jgi:hypothetical protein